MSDYGALSINKAIAVSHRPELILRLVTMAGWELLLKVGPQSLSIRTPVLTFGISLTSLPPTARAQGSWNQLQLGFFSVSLPIFSPMPFSCPATSFMYFRGSSPLPFSRKDLFSPLESSPSPAHTEAALSLSSYPESFIVPF